MLEYKFQIFWPFFLSEITLYILFSFFELTFFLKLLHAVFPVLDSFGITPRNIKAMDDSVLHRKTFMFISVHAITKIAPLYLANNKVQSYNINKIETAQNKSSIKFNWTNQIKRPVCLFWLLTKIITFQSAQFYNWNAQN